MTALLLVSLIEAPALLLLTKLLSWIEILAALWQLSSVASNLEDGEATTVDDKISF